MDDATPGNGLSQDALLAAALRAVRRARGMRATDVALAMGLPLRTYQHFEEATKGSLVAGKLADFALLSQDPTAVDPEKLASLKVVETIKEGVSIWRG